jgi:hypothetical protein
MISSAAVGFSHGRPPLLGAQAPTRCEHELARHDAQILGGRIEVERVVEDRVHGHGRNERAYCEAITPMRRIE